MLYAQKHKANVKATQRFTWIFGAMIAQVGLIPSPAEAACLCCLKQFPQRDQ